MMMRSKLRSWAAATLLLPAWVCCRAGSPGPAGQSWHLETLDTSLTVSANDTGSVVSWLSTVGGRWNWAAGGLAVGELPKAITREGREVPLSWKLVSGAMVGDTLTLRFEAVAAELEARVYWSAAPRRGPARHWIELTNRSSSGITLGQVESIDLTGLAVPASVPVQSTWIRRGASNATIQGGVVTEIVGANWSGELVSDTKQGSSPVPWLALQVLSGAAGQHGLYIGWEFSGLGRVQYSAADGHGEVIPAHLRAGNLPAFRTDVRAQETFVVPAAFVGCYTGDMDDGSYSLHRFVKDILMPKPAHPSVTPTLAYNVYIDGEKNREMPEAGEASLLRSAQMAKDLGFESFVVDAMWFPQTGDWRWDPARFPRGPKFLIDYLSRAGMQYGLWMAIGTGGDAQWPDAVSVRNQPGWFSPRSPKLDPSTNLQWNAAIDLGNDEARARLKKITAEEVRAQGIQYFKTDGSLILDESSASSRARYGSDVSYWSTLGYYEVIDNLRRQFPDLVIEGCSGGGHVKDFGHFHRIDYLTSTDTLASLPDRQSMYDSTFAFPPSALQLYSYDSFYNTSVDRAGPYMWRSGMMGAWQIDLTRSADLSERERAQIRAAVRIYKTWLRPVIQDAEVHHILPRPDGVHWDGLFYWNAGIKRGTVYIFRPASEQGAQRIHLKGLRPEAMYSLRSEDGSIPPGKHSGKDLMEQGLVVVLAERFSSDLLYVEEAL